MDNGHTQTIGERGSKWKGKRGGVTEGGLEGEKSSTKFGEKVSERPYNLFSRVNLQVCKHYTRVGIEPDDKSVLQIPMYQSVAHP